MTIHQPHDLLTVQEVARKLRLSDDTVRRQIREGTLEAIRVRTTPTGREQYRVPARAVEDILGTATSVPMPDLFAPLREAFSVLSEEEREEILAQAVRWARERLPEPAGERLPALTEEELTQRFRHSRLAREPQR